MTELEFKHNILPLNKKLLSFANRFVGDFDEAKDVVQEIFIKLWSMRETLEKYNSVEALAMRMTRNLCLDKLKLKKTIPIGDGVEIGKEEQSDFGEKYKEQEKFVARVKTAIDTLPEPQKTIMQLRDIDGYDYDEIAQIMKLNVNLLRVNVSRARKKVKAFLMKKYYDYEIEKNTNFIREIL
ncbi:MAG: sigma-70 family RNA polymerase sigma factor [Bacteroidales bacterium]|nr:sigma-70 family RNA polymerase sigma factor [Bacteroidales bacterium]